MVIQSLIPPRFRPVTAVCDADLRRWWLPTTQNSAVGWYLRRRTLPFNACDAEFRRWREEALPSLRCQPLWELSAAENLAIRHPCPYALWFPYAIIEDGFSHAGVCQFPIRQGADLLTVQPEHRLGHDMPRKGYVPPAVFFACAESAVYPEKWEFW